MNPIDRFKKVPKRFSDGPPKPWPLPPKSQRSENFVAARSAICDACDGLIPSGRKCALKDCKPCRRRNMLSRPKMACPADPPKWKPVSRGAGGERRESPGHKADAPSVNSARNSKESGFIRAVWTISAWNEPLLKQTVESLRTSVVDNDRIHLDIIVVDDASTQRCADGLHDPARGVTVIRNPKPMGIGYNLNMAAGYALGKMGADIVGVADAHMKIPEGALDMLARRAVEEKCVLTSAAFGWEETSRMRQWGGYLVRTARDCLAVKWMGSRWAAWGDPPRHEPLDEWAKVEAPLGAFYAMSRETILALEAPTHRLWETVRGRWGFLLEPLAVKCRFLGIPVYVSRDHYTRHFYRKRNPFPGATREKVLNIAFATGALFHEEVWARYFERWCKTRRGVTPVEIDAAAAAGRHGVKRPWTSSEEEEFLMSVEPVGPGIAPWHAARSGKAFPNAPADRMLHAPIAAKGADERGDRGEITAHGGAK